MTEWTTPHTWATDEEVTAALMNQIRDELSYLFEKGSLIAFEYPHTCDPRITDVLSTVGTTNDCHYNRVYHGGAISSIRVSVGTSNGNISVAVYDTDGTGVTAEPNARTATSGSVACPASGLADVSLGATVTVGHASHWFALSANGTTATFRSAAAIPAGWHNGINWAQATAHPAPDPAVPAASRASQLFILIGV
jgi:hypothetical protein